MTYWDTSALIAALHDEAIRDRLATGETRASTAVPGISVDLHRLLAG